MHRIAIGDPQCIRHQLFAELRIRMVDGESVRRELYPRGCGSLGLVGCGDLPLACRDQERCSCRDLLGHAHGKRAVRPRAGDRSRGEPVQFQWWGEDFEPAIAPTRPLLRGDGRLQDCGMVKKCAADLPDVSNCFSQASMPATACYFAWGCFRYFDWSSPCGAVARGRGARLRPVASSPSSLSLRSSYAGHRFALQAPLGCATRSPKGEAWWARQDSNLQPDRYERPALTIELQAPPQELPPWAARNGAATVYRDGRDPAMPGWMSSFLSILSPSCPAKRPGQARP